MNNIIIEDFERLSGLNESIHKNVGDKIKKLYREIADLQDEMVNVYDPEDKESIDDTIAEKRQEIESLRQDYKDRHKKHITDKDELR